MSYSSFLWKKTAPIYQAILDHPFICELAAGTLDRDRFEFYLEQDAIYLIHFSRALAQVAARSTASSTITDFLRFALDALLSERELHQNFLQKEIDEHCGDLAPATLAYSNYLIASAATAPLEEAIAALLPCFWIYNEISLRLISSATAHNPYAPWIETYSAPHFEVIAARAISYLDKIAETASPHTLKRMETAFELSTLYEWHFWNDAYQFNRIHSLKIPVSV